MWKSRLILAALLTAATAAPPLAAEEQVPAAQDMNVNEGQMIYTTSGHALLPIYRLTQAGEPQVIVQGRFVTVPAATLSMPGKKLTTSLSIEDLRRMARR